ncbi:Macrolide export ATP-binding/permease protein MacB [Roseimaritima multifibrata]|uniref:Macrolide export ATP-binding/permease protein MacB n=1 Tax=Roseimaritima multifibrata TaxID=1930274 RepID=A0A517MCA2_9BACT|nr:ABC transporter permease [Roseimaritima multifibrata]QDS92523.1 Macrolide export ATP-binding/permease protein MacB [Roseimaritima multifibrata]
MHWATLKLAIRNVLLHKMRSFLTLLGTILGVASVIAMLSVGEGSKKEALAQIRKLGAANVIVRSIKPKPDEASGSNATQPGMVSTTGKQTIQYGLTRADLRILQELPTVEKTVPMLALRKAVQHGRRRLSEARILGTIPEFAVVKGVTVRPGGRFLRAEDERSMANVAVLTQGAAVALFGFHNPVGEPLLIGSGAYRVVGVLDSQDSGAAKMGSGEAANQNRDIYIPLSAARSRFGETQVVPESGGRRSERVELSEITLAVNNQDEELVRPTSAMVRDILAKQHPVQSDYEVYVPLELLAQAEHEKRIWNIVLGSIAGISLLVGGIGIMNIMLATVTERTREIGIRRAIGAKRKDIIRQFLFETTVLSTTGGLLGIALGVTIPVIVTYILEVETATTLSSILLAFGISVVTGIIFGVYPAYKAASMNPIEALRHQ